MAGLFQGKYHSSSTPNSGRNSPTLLITMKSVNVCVALAVFALVLGMAAASCGCASSGKDVCGGGCSRTVVRPSYIPAPKPQPVVRKYVTVVKQHAPEPEPCYQPEAPKAQPVYYVEQPAPAPQPVYIPVPVARAAPAPCAAQVQQERVIEYVSAPTKRVVYRPQVVVDRLAPAPAPVCTSCYRPSSNCGCN
ncbi:hypothetical protein FOCC_FOCC009411 [Frankliniella occidentalis]|uniref:Translation initiation factor IF-2-like n=1 Tax=Frankliniella occidentalis TaxID=133901 RepID=A0A6J1TJQ7_FRAOC|nr:translation initiation factor IF-2-like [Frankliniella occidentalis]KAE8743948.1 hypothetical protein FOCC_FOCC009411 [Frankliniella occidentalis]